MYLTEFDTCPPQVCTKASNLVIFSKVPVQTHLKHTKPVLCDLGIFTTKL